MRSSSYSSYCSANEILQFLHRLARKAIPLFESYYGIALTPAFKDAIITRIIEEDFDFQGTASASAPTLDPGIWQDLPTNSPLEPIGTAINVNRTENHFSPRLNHGLGTHTFPLPENRDAIDWATNDLDNLMDWSDAVTAGDTTEGWRRLGHVLHVLQDLLVPDHVRNDYHAFDDYFGELPYEHYVGTLSQSHFDALPTGPLTMYTKPRDILQNAQTFTQSNFFSRSTVFKSG